jgi:hypothetical protein
MPKGKGQYLKQFEAIKLYEMLLAAKDDEKSKEDGGKFYVYKDGQSDETISEEASRVFKRRVSVITVSRIRIESCGRLKPAADNLGQHYTNKELAAKYEALEARVLELEKAHLLQANRPKPVITPAPVRTFGS